MVKVMCWVGCVLDLLLERSCDMFCDLCSGAGMGQKLMSRSCV